MHVLELTSVSKGYGDGSQRIQVLEEIDLAIDEGEFVAVIGFSGTGKTTLVSLMAGLQTPDSGEVRFRGAPVTGAGPERGVVFQNYSLLPWLDVWGNVSLAVDRVFRDEARSERRARVERYLAMVGLADAGTKRPCELSGGMRQRTALARALAAEPELILLDEPLGALDALTRATLQREIERISIEESRTAVLVTNEIDEAILLADRIVTLEPGPPARLGRVLDVELPRPRDPATLDVSPEYRRLRSELVTYLSGLRTRRRVDEAGAGARPPLPDVRPLDPACAA